MSNDMTKKQFDAACDRYGFKTRHFMGYYEVGHGRECSVLNAGSRRRNQLAYLILQSEKAAVEDTNA